MVKVAEKIRLAPQKSSIALSMMGTTTPGALRAKKILEDKGYEVVTFHLCEEILSLFDL